MTTEIRSGHEAPEVHQYQDILDAYMELKNYKLVAERFGIKRSTVHLRLQKHPDYKPISRKRFTEEQKERIRNIYCEGFKVNDGSLSSLSSDLGLNKQFISRYAREEGLTNKNRGGAKWRLPPKPPKTPKPYIHPRGMLGKRHSIESKRRMSISHLNSPVDEDILAERTLKAMKTRLEKYGTLAPRHPQSKVRSWRADWRTIGGQRKYFRSRWEANYARVLQNRLECGAVLSWEHEPHTFWFEKIKRGCVSYLPDFRVTFPDGSIEYHEVKGWMDDRSVTKLKRMKKYYPDVKIVLIDSKWFKSNKNYQLVISDWEFG